MSSLALQLFVNLNKLIHPQSCAGLGSHYAKHLVDRVRAEHPQLLACTDPSNAHTAALSAFALGIGLRELRHEGAHPGVIEGVAEILKTALERADEGLEQLASEEVHLLLQAHEDYKTHLGVRNEHTSTRGKFGSARGAADVIPMATVGGHASSAISWKDPDSTLMPPLHASDIDVGPLALPEISQAMTGEASFLTQPTFELSAHPLDSGEDVIEIEEEEVPSEHDDGPVSVAPPRAVPVPTQPSTPVLPTAHPVRQDRNAEREFSDNNELAPESIDSMLARKRQREAFGRQEIPLHASWEGPDQVRHAERVRGSLLDERSEFSESGGDTSTYLHSESAPDSSIITRGKKKASIPLVLWAAPTFLILPPVALFYSGVLWGRREYGQSIFALSLGIAGAGGMIASWFLFLR